MPLAILFSTGSIQNKQKSYYFFPPLLGGGACWALFCALDSFLFYIFWEAMLIPMYFLIGIYGHGRKSYAALKFFLFTLVGSVLMLLGMIYLYYQAGDSFLLSQWMELTLSPKVQLVLFSAFALSFAIKMPLFPVHTWLPDAHTEAPTAGSVILAGVLLKMGAYGFVRFAMPLFPEGFGGGPTLFGGPCGHRYPLRGNRRHGPERYEAFWWPILPWPIWVLSCWGSWP